MFATSFFIIQSIFFFSIVLIHVLGILFFFGRNFSILQINSNNKFVRTKFFPRSESFTQLGRGIPPSDRNWTIFLNYSLINYSLPHFINNKVTYPPANTSFYIEDARTASILFTVTKDIYLTSQCAPIINNTIYYQVLCKSERKVPTIYAGTYDNVLSMCFSPMKNYAHFTFDVFSFLFYVPEEVMKKSLFLSQSLPEFAFEALSFFIRRDQILIINQNQFIYALTVYAFAPTPCDTQNGRALHRLRHFIKDKFGLDKEKPDLIALLNRKKSRNIKNLDKIGEVAKEKYPHFKIIYDTPCYKTYRENSRYYNKIMLLFTPHGAGCVNLVFMQTQTVFCEIQSDISYFAFYNISRHFDIFHIFARIPNMAHFKKGKYNFPVKTAMEMIDIGISFLRVNSSYLV